MPTAVLTNLLRMIHRTKELDGLSGVQRAIENAHLSKEERAVAMDTLSGRREYLAKIAVTL